MNLSMASLIVPLLLGVFAHLGVFIRGEWHLQAPKLVLLHGLAVCGILTFGLRREPSEYVKALTNTSISAALYLTGLYTSIATYRVFFHRLCAFPGPRLATVSKLWHVWECRDSRGHRVLARLHQQYGDIVRTGPGEITLFGPKAFEILDGPGTQNTRSDWYDLLYPRISSIFTRDKEMHKSRRKLWEKIMYPSSVRAYNAAITTKARELVEIIGRSTSKPVLMNDLILWYAFDSMGSFGFGIEFGMMRNGRPIEGFLHMRSAMQLLGPFSPAIWIPRLGFSFIPMLWKVRHWFQMLKFSDKCMDTCLQAQQHEKPVCIAAVFIEDYQKSQKGLHNDRILSGDSANLLVAASESTGTSMTFLIYCLAKYPEHADKIREELKSVDMEDMKALAALPHLEGTIKEALRMHPAIPTAVSRKVPAEGIMIDGLFVPGGTKLCAPRYSIHRSEDAFERPLDFIPERWYSRPELVKEPKAFAPFGMGRTLCVGKNLAMTQMRTVAALLLSEYRFKFVPGDNDGEAVERDMKDQLTANPGHLRLIFEKR